MSKRSNIPNWSGLDFSLSPDNKPLGCPGNFAMRLSDSMPLAFGHNAINPGGFGAEHPREPVQWPN